MRSISSQARLHGPTAIGDGSVSPPSAMPHTRLAQWPALGVYAMMQGHGHSVLGEVTLAALARAVRRVVEGSTPDADPHAVVSAIMAGAEGELRRLACSQRAFERMHASIAVAAFGVRRVALAHAGAGGAWLVRAGEFEIARGPANVPLGEPTPHARRTEVSRFDAGDELWLAVGLQQGPQGCVPRVGVGGSVAPGWFGLRAPLPGAGQSAPARPSPA